MEWLIAEFKKETGIDVSKDRMVLQRLKEAAEKAKIELSSTMETEINLPFLTADASGPKHLMLKLSRSKLEQLVMDLVERSIEPCRQAMKDAGVSPSDIDEVVLVGGSTRMPLVAQKVQEFFQKAPNRTVNPDEVVALGAAVQAGVLGGEVKDVLLLDVTPLSLGIETLGGVMTTLISRNTTIPTHKSEIFSTAADNQTTVEIHVLQGERPMAPDNKTLGRFQLTGIPPAPRGMPQVEVSFDIDANGIVHVTAKDKATNKEQKIQITSASGLNKDEVDRMVREAQSHEADDRLRKDEIEAHNQLDTLIYGTDKLLTENRESLPPEEVSRLESSLEDARKALQEGGLERLKPAHESLQKASHKLAELMYQRASTGGAGGPGGAQGGAEQAGGAKGSQDNVIDAEFEDAS